MQRGAPIRQCMPGDFRAKQFLDDKRNRFQNGACSAQLWSDGQILALTFTGKGFHTM